MSERLKAIRELEKRLRHDETVWRSEGICLEAAYALDAYATAVEQLLARIGKEEKFHAGCTSCAQEHAFHADLRAILAPLSPPVTQ